MINNNQSRALFIPESSEFKQDHLNLTYLLEQKQSINPSYLESSFLDQTILGIYNQISKNPNADRINQGFQQIENLFNRLADVSDLTKMSHSYKRSTDFNKPSTIEDDFKEELKDQVYDLPAKQMLINNPFQQTPEREEQEAKQNTFEEQIDKIEIKTPKCNLEFNVQSKLFTKNNSTPNLYTLYSDQKLKTNPTQSDLFSQQKLKKSDIFEQETALQTKKLNSLEYSGSQKNRLFDMTQSNLTTAQKPQWKKKDSSQIISKIRSQTMQCEYSNQEFQILCMNCDQYIHSAQVDQHCKKCLTQQDLKQPIKEIDQLNQKLELLKANLLKQNLSNKQIYALDGLIQNNDNAQEYHQHLKKLQKLYHEYEEQVSQNKFFISMLLQRAILLSEEKGLRMQIKAEDSCQFQSVAKKMAELDQEQYCEIEKQKRQMMEMVNKGNSMNFRRNRNLEVLSQISSAFERRTIQQENQSQFRYTNSLTSDLNYQNNVDSQYSGRTIKQSEFMPKQVSSLLFNFIELQDAKRFFYNLAVCAKLNLPPNHPAKNILISDIYESIIKNQILQQDWQNYISQAFQNM